MSIEEITRGLENRWRDSEYKIVLEKMTLTKSWPEESRNIMESLWSWMAENEIETKVEEGEDILDGLETMLTEEGSGVSGDILMDATEIITAIMVARGLVTKRVAPLFQKDGKVMTDRIKRIGRAEGTVRMREEMRKVKNIRLKPNSRSHKENDFEEMEIRRMRRADCSNRMETGILRSDMVDKGMVQDRGNKIQVVGSDVEALYPSLEAC